MFYEISAVRASLSLRRFLWSGKRGERQHRGTQTSKNKSKNVARAMRLHFSSHNFQRSIAAMASARKLDSKTTTARKSSFIWVSSSEQSRNSSAGRVLPHSKPASSSLDFVCSASQYRRGRDGDNMNRTRARVCILMLSFFLSSANAAGQASTKPAPKTPAKTMPKSPLDDAMRAMFSLHEFQQAVISPDGTQLAWVESFFGPGGAPSGNSAIYMAKLSERGQGNLPESSSCIYHRNIERT